ncbi:phage tail protein [Pseudoxanthomonas wuyuanensis]|uniref:P2 phage tail completion protein R (GpR) n=1 Tax=Pseudoxanthomonas wuyuanensis TaxID=1073196 RepID=A0A286D4U9_9GAMM|nr:phage tail protein [Pseudoxanthomonas wuyuanensis]KAF1719807.1 phage tail protein [Pseudoxanthomonas wuyuanensis]SOD53679.1 P2 phage tail completion protein R (GpR) [Pseudoxanthomonas wuyuanensis]
MNKPQSLRDHLSAAVEDLRRDPERLLVFIEGGSVVSTLAPGASFEYRYTLKLVVTDFGGHPDALMVPLLDWVRAHQSELLANDRLREQIRFEAEVLANDKVDVELTLPLTERVGVHRHADGRVEVEHFPEPLIDGPLPARHWQLYVMGELAAEWDAPGG